MKRFASLLLIATLLGACAPRRADAQGRVFNIPQSTSKIATVQCNSTAVVQNVGQSTHSLSYQTNLGTAHSSYVWVEGSNDGLTFDALSDVGQGQTGQVIGFGYRTVMQIHFTCDTAGIGAGSVAIQYAGTSAPADRIASSLEGAVRKLLGTGVPAGGGLNTQVSPPFGSTQGTLVFIYSGGGAGPAGSTVAIKIVDAVSALNRTVATFTLGTSNSVPQVFLIPSVPAAVNFGTHAQMTIEVDYVAGGASADTFTMAYYFDPPGYLQNGFGFSYANVTTNADAAIKGGTGELHGLAINIKGTTSTAILWDGAIAGGVCTGTKIATVDTGTSLSSLFYDVQFNTGLCVTTAGVGAANLTLFYK